MRVIFSSDSYDKPRKNLYSTLRLGIDILMIILYRLSRYTNIVRVAKAAAHILGEVSERFMELVLKTSDSLTAAQGFESLSPRHRPV